LTTVPPTSVVTRAPEELQILYRLVAAKQRWATGAGCAREDCSLDLGEAQSDTGRSRAVHLGLVTQRTSRRVSGYR
jgi:hypothetical protein